MSMLYYTGATAAVCVDRLITTNPTATCGTSLDWQYSASVSGPWGSAFNINSTCGLTNTPGVVSIPGAGWISPTATGVGISPGPHYFRHQFTITSQEDIDYEAIGIDFAGDITVQQISLNGTAIYSSGTGPANAWNQMAHIDIAIVAATLVVGTNTLIVQSAYDGINSDGIILAMTLKCDAVDLMPVITTQPTSQSTTSTGSVTFTSGSSGGNAPVTGQWQQSLDGGVTWTNISGATSTSLTISGASATTGTQYRYRATDLDGDIATSNAATLTIGSGTAPVAASVTSFFTGTFPARVGDLHRPVKNVAALATTPSDPILATSTRLEPGQTMTDTIAGVGTWQVEADGRIAFFPVEGFQGSATHQYSVATTTGTRSAPSPITYTFDPYYWDGPLPRATAPTATATVAPSGLQAAINAAAAGAVIHVTSGTHAGRISVNKVLTIWSQTKWGAKFSAGMDITAGATLDGIEVTGAATNAHGLNIDASNVTLRHIKITTPNPNHNLDANASNNLLVESSEFYKPDGSAQPGDFDQHDPTYGGAEMINLYHTNCSGAVYRNCKMFGGQHQNILFNNSSNILIEHCWIEKSRRQGAKVYDSLDVWYINNRVFNVGEAGLQYHGGFVTAGGQGNRAEFNTVWSDDPMAPQRIIDPISFVASGGESNKKMTMYKNRFKDNGGHPNGSGGMTGDGGGGHQDVIENYVRTPGQVGIGIYGGSFITCRRNKVLSDQHPNIMVGGGQVGMFVWEGPTHQGIVFGRNYGWGNHIHDTNRIYWRRPDGSFNNQWINDPASVAGEETNILGSAGNYVGLTNDLIERF